MKIKEILKNYNMSLHELAVKLSLSRPTLNNYIKEFEDGGELSNKNYCVIFKKLFNSDVKDELKFKDEVEKISLMIQKQKKIIHHEYSNENMNIMNSIIKKMQEDLQGKKETNPLYKFINSAIYNYEKDSILKAYINYNLYLNGLKDLSQINDQEKKLFSNLFPLMNLYLNSKINFDENGYDEFLKRVNEIKQNRINEKEKIEKKIKEKVAEEITKKLHEGIDIKSLDINEILKNIKI